MMAGGEECSLFSAVFVPDVDQLWAEILALKSKGGTRWEAFWRHMVNFAVLCLPRTERPKLRAIRPTLNEEFRLVEQLRMVPCADAPAGSAPQRPLVPVAEWEDALRSGEHPTQVVMSDTELREALDPGLRSAHTIVLLDPYFGSSSNAVGRDAFFEWLLTAPDTLHRVTVVAAYGFHDGGRDHILEQIGESLGKVPTTSRIDIDLALAKKTARGSISFHDRCISFHGAKSEGFWSGKGPRPEGSLPNVQFPSRVVAMGTGVAAFRPRTRDPVSLAALHCHNLESVLNALEFEPDRPDKSKSVRVRSVFRAGRGVDPRAFAP